MTDLTKEWSDKTRLYSLFSILTDKSTSFIDRLAAIDHSTSPPHDHQAACDYGLPTGLLAATNISVCDILPTLSPDIWYQSSHDSYLPA